MVYGKIQLDEFLESGCKAQKSANDFNHHLCCPDTWTTLNSKARDGHVSSISWRCIISQQLKEEKALKKENKLEQTAKECDIIQEYILKHSGPGQVAINYSCTHPERQFIFIQESGTRR